MISEPGPSRAHTSKPDWYKDIVKYGQPNLRKAILQLINTVIPYIALWTLMVLTVHYEYSYWITLALAAVSAIFYIRTFIIFHDCCHGSFFASSQANSILGHITGIMTFTPFNEWRHSHGMHHITVGDLDRRGTGDVWTLTVEDYLSAPWQTRLAYRLFRNPLLLFGIAPPVLFLLVNRFSSRGARKRERLSVIFTNLAILAIIGAAALTIGFRTYLIIQMSIVFIAGPFGLWLFYIQHQFEGVYWARHGEWDRMRAALEGSSYYRLPRILQWCTGNIGLHHIHHVLPLIPNYNLQQCYDDIPALQAVEPLTIRRSLRSLWMNLYNEQQKKLVSFRSLKVLPEKG